MGIPQMKHDYQRPVVAAKKGIKGWLTAAPFVLPGLLLVLRNSSDVVKYGDFRLLISEHPQLFAYSRTYQDERIIVCCNFSEETVQLPGEISGEVLLQFGNQNRSLAAYGALVVGLNL